MLHRLFLILSFLCLLLSQYKLVTVKSEKQVVVHAQAQLNKLETEIQQSLDKISTFQTPEQFHEYFIHSGLQNQGFSFFYLENRQLLYWSDNETTLANPDTINDKTLLRLSNGLYEAFVKQQGNKKIIGLLLLKKDYAYENKYLVNNFNAQLGLGENASLSANASAFPLNSIDEKKLISVTFSQDSATESSFNLQSWLYLTSYLFLLAAVLLYVLALSTPRLDIIFLISFFLIAARLVMITIHLPSALYHTDFFSPRFYASSFLFNSIGDFFLNSLTFYCLAVIINRIRNQLPKAGFFIIVLYGILILLAVFIHTLIAGLILNSKITFDVTNIPDLNINSLVGLLSIMLLLWGYLMLVKAVLSLSFQSKSTEKRHAINRILPLKLADSEARILLLLLFSLYTSFIITHYSRIKERDNRKLFAQQLDTRQDHLSEYLFEDVERLVTRDTAIIQVFRQKKKVTENVNKRLQQIYFNGYWSKFNISTWCFDENDQSEPHAVSSLQLQDFRMQVQYQGRETYSDKLFFLQNESGRLSYLAILPLHEEKDSTVKIGTIVLRFDGRIIQRAEGFPELFVSSRVSPEVKTNQPNYSFAQYVNDSLISTYGNYSYPFSSSVIISGIKEHSSGNGDFIFFRFDGFDHLIYKASPATLIVVSHPKERLFNIVSLFSYVLLFFSLFYFLTKGAVSLIKSKTEVTLTLKQRIRSSVVVLVILSFVLIATGTIIYLIRKYDKDQDQNILARLNSLWFVLYDNFTFQSNLSSLNYEEWSPQLNQLADNLNVDFNLYDEAGNIFYSSQGKIFDQGIISTRMNPKAFFELNKYSRTQYVQPENTGRLKYIAAYAPFTNQKGNITGYVNLPYFEKQNELKKEIGGFLSALINIYVLLLVIAILLALFISSLITQPLLLIQEKLKTIREKSLEFGDWAGSNGNRRTLYAKLDWKREDEIGELVQEYNRMVSELEASAEKLARSERESAWREMAQQVAHEIKNPLTPMKLSVQHLQLAWNEKRENLDELFNRISKTLIEQINTLSNIATEFSNFAKMPKAKNELLKPEDIIQSSILLFEDTPHIKIEYQHSVEYSSGKVFADKEQLKRVFSNLIKNAIQSIDPNKEGVINIRTKIEGEQYLVEIKDSGSGIAVELQPKIFTPYFTTKNSGMGLGLAMVKSIIEELGGSIRFESREGHGTTFFVTLPATNDMQPKSSD